MVLSFQAPGKYVHLEVQNQIKTLSVGLVWIKWRAPSSIFHLIPVDWYSSVAHPTV